MANYVRGNMKMFRSKRLEERLDDVQGKLAKQATKHVALIEAVREEGFDVEWVERYELRPTSKTTSPPVKEEGMQEKTKVCTKCKKEKKVQSFSSNKSRDDGLQVWCKSCLKKHSKKNKNTKRVKNKNYYNTSAKNFVYYCVPCKEIKRGRSGRHNRHNPVISITSLLRGKTFGFSRSMKLHGLEKRSEEILSEALDAYNEWIKKN